MNSDVNAAPSKSLANVAIGPMIRNARIILIKSVSAGTANVLNRSLILFAKNYSIFAAK